MAKYMIHAYPKRMWYVEEYLVPSMLAQGIDENSIIVYNDDKHLGNLRACMDAFSSLPDSIDGTWHLQDDVCICKNFKKLTELYDRGIVCGFSSKMYDGEGRIGAVHAQKMWFSFPCIRIPNNYAHDCGSWVVKYIIGNPVYKEFWQKGVNDDWAFRQYVNTFHKEDLATNLAPNLVDHVDYLLGGGSGGTRKVQVRAQYWDDNDIVEELERKILKRC